MFDDGDVMAVEDAPPRLSVSCENIPELFLDKLVAKKHFGQFGKIKRFILRPKRLLCTVEYETQEAAEAAIAKGCKYKDHTFSIYWTEDGALNRSDETAANVLDPDVQQELESMSGHRSKATNSNAVPSKSIESFLKRTERFPALPLVSSSKPRLAPLSVKVDLDPKIAQTKMEFETLARKPAVSAEDRYRLLELKDKYIRLTMDRTTDIKKAKSTVGTCPDMCPEKERYMRECKFQVSSFESAGNQQMDHSKAIKQYSRSSADQETPLPHELRNEAALALTMNFLLTNVVNRCDDDDISVSDWFHYIWDRTRGVRKDIAQQDLCSVVAVELMEQCARFHIHCAARLVAEDPSVFDQKINTENMTKCQQSLKYMYHDLGLRGIRCPNEAEFRCYGFLLYLNDGNFLWELKHLPPDIVNSQEVRFALEVYFALRTNNFARFFQLVRQTTYMNACILLRYFTQVRLNALRIMLKAYTIRTTANVGLEHLTHMLAFEDEVMATAFVEHYGLVVDFEQGSVILDAKQFISPEYPYELERAFIIVESKRTCSVGQAIAGRPLSPLAGHIIYDSFDQTGCLKESVLRDILWQSREDPENNLFKIPSPTTALPKSHAVKAAPQNPPTPRGIAKIETGPALIPPTATSIFDKSSPSLSIPGITPLKPSSPPPAAPSISSPFQPITAGSSGIFMKPTASTVSFGSSSFSEPLVKPSNIFSKPSNTPTTPQVNFGQSPSSWSTPTTSANLFTNANNTHMPSFSSFASADSLFKAPATNSNSLLFSTVPTTKASPSSIFQPAPAIPVLGASGAATFSKPLFGSTPTPVVADSTTSTGSIFGSAFVNSNSTNNSSSNAFSASSNIFGGTTGNIFTKSDPLPPAAPQSTDDEKKHREQEERRCRELIAKKEAEIQRLKELEQEEQRKLEVKQRILKDSETILEQLLDDHCGEEVTAIVAECYERHQWLEEYPEQVYAELLDEVIADSLQEIAQQELMVKSCMENRQVNLLRKYFLQWRKAAGMMASYRKLMESSPGWLPSRRLDELAQQCRREHQQLNLSNMQRYVSGRPASIRLPDTSEKKIDVLRILEETAIHRRQVTPGLTNAHVYWKLGISIPFKQEEKCLGFYYFIQKWLTNAFEQTKNNKYLYLTVSESASLRKRLVICLRLIRGLGLLNEQNNRSVETFDNSDGLLFYLTSNDIAKSRERLRNVLQRAERFGPIPLAIVSYNSTLNEEELTATLRLDELLSEEKISDHRFFLHQESSRIPLRQCVVSALRYLASNLAPNTELEMQSQGSFLATCLGEELWYRLRLSTEQNRYFLRATNDADFVISLFNQAIKRVANVVQHNFAVYPDFPEEFQDFLPSTRFDIPLNLEYFPRDWKDPSRQKRLLAFLQQLQLHPIDQQATPPAETIEALEQQLESYVSQCYQPLPSNCSSKRIALLMVQTVLAQCKQPLTFKANLALVSWVPTIGVLSHELMKVRWNEHESNLPDEVIYQRKEYESYTKSLWWLDDLKKLKLTKRLSSSVSTETPNTTSGSELDDTSATIPPSEPSAKRIKVNVSITRDEMERVLSKGMEALQRAEKRLTEWKQMEEDTRSIARGLDRRLYEQQRLMRKNYGELQQLMQE